MASDPSGIGGKHLNRDGLVQWAGTRDTGPNKKGRVLEHRGAGLSHRKRQLGYRGFARFAERLAEFSLEYMSKLRTMPRPGI